MKKIIVLFLLVWNTSVVSQNIISLPILATGIVDIGQNMQTQFTVKKLTFCDSYSINTEINYVTKTITIKVDYNYIPSCSENVFGMFENISKQVLLTGNYNVALKLNVATNPSLNENYQLGTLFVQIPPFSSCSNPLIPWFFDVCPIIFNQVCACDGQTYQNECQSYLMEKKGLFVQGNCMNYLDFNDQKFECTVFNSFNAKKFLEQYGCLPDEFKGEEMYFQYQNTQKRDLDIRFETSSLNVKLFLVKLENNSLVCLASSVGDSLLYDQLEKGDYYIISDRLDQGSYAVKFCTQISSVNNPSTSVKASVFPNPTLNNLRISNASKLIEKVEIIDRVGVLVLSKVINSHEYNLIAEGLLGIYIMKIWYQDGSSEFQKIIFQN